MKKYSPEQIWDLLDADKHVFTLENDCVGWNLSKALAQVPMEVADTVMSSCYAVVVTYEDKGMYLDRGWLDERGIIAFHESVLTLPDSKRRRIILHEVAHLWLGHKVQIGLSQEEKDKRERDADELADKWIRGIG